MKGKYKLTGFARLFIFLLFFLPIVYIGVSFYHGENPLEKIENLFGKKENKPVISKERFGVKDEDQLKKELKGKDELIDELRTRIQNLEKELDQLKNQSHDHN